MTSDPARWRPAAGTVARVNAAQFVNLLCSGVLTGNELGTWAVVHPALQRLPFDEEVAAEREVTRRYGFFMPGLMTLTVVSGFVAAGTADGGSDRRLLLAGSASYAAMLAVTLAGNVPINVRTLRFSPSGTREDWRRLRRRWDRLHAVRVVLDTGGLICAAVAAL
jgi:uncharacterized membrane protein